MNRSTRIKGKVTSYGEGLVAEALLLVDEYGREWVLRDAVPDAVLAKKAAAAWKKAAKLWRLIALQYSDIETVRFLREYDNG